MGAPAWLTAAMIFSNCSLVITVEQAAPPGRESSGQNPWTVMTGSFAPTASGCATGPGCAAMTAGIPVLPCGSWAGEEAEPPWACAAAAAARRKIARVGFILVSTFPKNGLINWGNE